MVFTSARSACSNVPVEAEVLDPERLDAALARQGGTFLGSTNRGDPFAPSDARRPASRDRSGEMIEGCACWARRPDRHRRRRQPRHPASFAEAVGRTIRRHPKTIDNDVAKTERAIGYPTAVAIATEALDRLHPTGASHERVMVLEVMGRDAGHIAIAAGIAGAPTSC